MKVTSAQANKMLKEFNEEKSYWLEKEKDSRFYIVTVGEDPVIPKYDYHQVSDKIRQIDEKTIILKHALNMSNLTDEISFCDKRMTIDAALIRMAQLSKRKDFLDTMRKHPEKKRIVDRYNSTPDPEYECVNYDISAVELDYEKVSRELSELQMALDAHNHSVMFEVEI